MTLNQIITRVRTLALSHHQVNDFYFGDVQEFLANGEINYPAVFLEQQPGSISRTEKQQRFNFRLYALNRVGVSTDTEGNETEVLSDMNSVVSDIYAMLLSSTYQDDWMISDNVTVGYYTESLEDMVAGASIDIGVLIDFLADRCQVPSSDVSFETDIDMARTRLISYESAGLSGDSFTVSSIAGKIVLAAYRAGNYKRPILTTPTDASKIKVTGTDVSTKTDEIMILATGAIELEAGDSLLNDEILDFLIYD
jgi:hypothetical protein